MNVDDVRVGDPLQGVNVMDAEEERYAHSAAGPGSNRHLVVASDVPMDRVADLAGVHHVVCMVVPRLETQRVAGHSDDRGRLCPHRQGLSLGRYGRDRLFQQQVLARLHDGGGVLEVHIVGRAETDRVDRVVC